MNILSKVSLSLVFLSVSVATYSQSGQLAIDKVNQMPSLPSPYIMRDWKKVATQYDSIIYSLNATGQYLPLMHLKTSGVNYPSVQPILLDSYVGSASAGKQAEAINIIPSVVGATLVGIDKSNQSGTNWVLKTKDFFNKANGQNIYLNGYSAASGGDWWYDLMPNLFFYQLYSQYPSTPDFNTQFTTVADRWLSAVSGLGGSTTPWSVPQMDVRAYNFSSMTANTSGVHEPEGAGAVAYILYHAYVVTGDKKYREGAELAASFLSAYKTNPAYEIQLPYGTFIAAKMNAELGTHYNISKMLNWSFDQSSERNWGTIVGKWGDGANVDVSGLVGEVDNASTGYAFAMNGFQQAAAFVPLVKYDKRFAHDIAKWTLNLANASRLFYSSYLAADHQDSFTWSSAHDPHSSIGYESLKQNSLTNIKLFATGDALRTGGAQTNLGLYGSSHVGYLGALVQTTDVDGILLLDVNKTDFFGPKSFPSFLIYNPYTTSKQVTLPLGGSTYDIYDAVSETMIQTGATGNYLLTMPADQARLLVYLPQGSSPVAVNGKYMLGNKIVDYNYAYDFSGDFRIRSLSSKDTLIQFNQSELVYGSVENKAGAVTYTWRVNNVVAVASADSVFHWTGPTTEGNYTIKLTATDGVSTVSDSVVVKVITKIPIAPITTGITKDSLWYYAGSTATLICHTTNPGSKLTYTWSVPDGTIISQKDSLIHWTVPSVDGMYAITCTSTNEENLSVSSDLKVLVKIKEATLSDPVAWFPLDGDFKDRSNSGHDATGSGVKLVADARGQSNEAYRFLQPTDIIDVPNATSLNFQDRITISFWLKLDNIGGEEYVISHGSYEERYKVSVTPTAHLRWSVKTSSATVDLDNTGTLLLNHYYHFSVVYSGYSMEIYQDGILDNFTAVGGTINTTTKDITFGRKDVSITDYHLLGTLDEVRIYNKALSPVEIPKLKTIWYTAEVVTGLKESAQVIQVYPNPAHGVINIMGVGDQAVKLRLMDMAGRNIPTQDALENDHLRVEYTPGISGVLLLRIETTNGIAWKKIVAN